jgi:RNA polymerase sigma factor (sigma-70 family)
MSDLNVFEATMDPLETQLVQELEGMFREHYRMIYRTSYAVTGNPEDAEDVVQAIFLRLVRREVPPDLKKNPGAYLYRAAVNESVSVIRERKRRVFSSVPSSMFDQTALAESDSPEEMHRRLYEAVAELTPQSAHILILRYLHDYSDAQIANLLGTSRVTIAVSLYRSRARLRKLLKAAVKGWSRR